LEDQTNLDTLVYYSYF